MVQNDFIDSYNVTMLLQDDDGKQYYEYHMGLSLSDFEVLYGNTVDEIIKLRLDKML
ncbi:hypothetical protein Goe23_00020 [Bacillus phage vB_BsuP-Goe23]|nr:hypothetical protein Goe23_00020 [Bacillus phage vB_BsuP-Goe23]